MDENTNIITVTRNELESTSDYVKEIQEQNRKIAELRKKQIFHSLEESTKIRLKLASDLQKWSDILGDKIFSQESVEKMSTDKAISMLKYVKNLQMKTLADSNRVEEILGKYLQSGAIESQLAENIESNQTERDKIKTELICKLQQMFKNSMNDESVTDANIVHNTDSDIKNDINLGLIDEANVEIDKNIEIMEQMDESEINHLVPENEENNPSEDDGLIDFDPDDF